MSQKQSVTLLGAVLVLSLVLKTADPASASEPPFGGARPKAHAAQDFPKRDEFRQSYYLSPGARVEVSVIYGPVSIETADTNAAEVHIVRSARSREDLSSRKINVQHTSASLVIRGERDRSEGPARVRHLVLLKLPRRIELSVESVNARLNVGEIDGAVRLSRINGAVKVARAAAHAEVTRINGSLTMTIAGIGKEGVRADQINGAVELRLPDETNAELRVTEFNGEVIADLPNVNVLEQSRRKIFRARIGTGGPPITFSDVNGAVRLLGSD